MNETPIPETDPTAEAVLKRRLLVRIAVAAVVVAGLLGGLALFDAINAPGRPPAAQLAAAPSPAEKPAAVEPARLEPGAEDKPETAAVAKLEEAGVPEGTASPGAPPLQPLPAEKPLTRPASSRPASLRPAEPVPPAASAAARPDPARELAQQQRGPLRAPASRPITQAGERQYALQIGVFGNLANAEDLRAKLELNGIPSSIEARVHVGPFSSRDEIDAARIKLKELGLENGLLVTMKTKVQ
jgi:DedD protein